MLTGTLAHRSRKSRRSPPTSPRCRFSARVGVRGGGGARAQGDGVPDPPWPLTRRMLLGTGERGRTREEEAAGRAGVT